MARTTMINSEQTSSAGGLEGCVDSCHEAFQACQRVITYCFGEGYGTVDPRHLQLFLDGNLVIGTCVELCGRQTELYAGIARAAAEACKACEEACEEYESERVFSDAVEAFRACYEACNELAGGEEIPGWEADGGESEEEAEEEPEEPVARTAARADRGKRTSRRTVNA